MLSHLKNSVPSRARFQDPPLPPPLLAQPGLHVAVERRAVATGLQQRGAPAAQFLACVAAGLGEGIVGGEDALLDIGQQHPVAVAGGGLGGQHQLGLGGLARGDVAHHFPDTHRAARGVAAQHRRGLEPALRAGFAQASLVGPEGLLAQAVLQHLAPARPAGRLRASLVMPAVGARAEEVPETLVALDDDPVQGVQRGGLVQMLEEIAELLLLRLELALQSELHRNVLEQPRPKRPVGALHRRQGDAQRTRRSLGEFQQLGQPLLARRALEQALRALAQRAGIAGAIEQGLQCLRQLGRGDLACGQAEQMRRAGVQVPPPGIGRHQRHGLRQGLRQRAQLRRGHRPRPARPRQHVEQQLEQIEQLAPRRQIGRHALDGVPGHESAERLAIVRGQTAEQQRDRDRAATGAQRQRQMPGDLLRIAQQLPVMQRPRQQEAAFDPMRRCGQHRLRGQVRIGTPEAQRAGAEPGAQRVHVALVAVEQCGGHRGSRCRSACRVRTPRPGTPARPR